MGSLIKNHLTKRSNCLPFSPESLEKVDMKSLNEAMFVVIFLIILHENDLEDTVPMGES